MAGHVYRRPLVGVDLVEAASYIADDNFGAALRFLEAAEECFRQLARAPLLGGAAGEYSSPFLKGVRRWRVKGFDSFLIFYRPVDDGVEILRVLHGARDIDAVFDSPE